METIVAEMNKYALYYGRLGWRIMPLHEARAGGCTCTAGWGCKTPGKHPRIMSWQTDASSDAGTIARWWRQWPNANIGLLTGINRAVLDIDPRHGGDESLAELEREHGPLPDTLTTLTGRGDGGEHRHFSISAPLPSEPDIAPGIELKATGAMVILPPSLHESGGRYQWEVSCHPRDTPLAPLPAWIRERAIQDNRPGPKLGDGWAAEWLRTPVKAGARRGPTGLPRIVGYLRGHGIDTETAVAIVELWDAQNPEPLGAEEVRRHVEEMYDRYQREPIAGIRRRSRTRIVRVA